MHNKACGSWWRRMWMSRVPILDSGDVEQWKNWSILYPLFSLKLQHRLVLEIRKLFLLFFIDSSSSSYIRNYSGNSMLTRLFFCSQSREDIKLKQLFFCYFSNLFSKQTTNCSSSPVIVVIRERIVCLFNFRWWSEKEKKIYFIHLWR